MSRPVVVVLGGLPATGKSTIARELNRAGAFAYVRIDTVEQALRDSGDLGPAGVVTAGYAVGYALTRDLLAGGNDVLVECVNPIGITRRAWADAARDRGAALVQVELRCTDADVHRARAESRDVDIAGLPQPDWAAIRDRDYEPWPDADLRLDTAVTSPSDAAARIREAVAAARTASA